MRNFRRYGKPPYKIAVIHGGPGAAGEMAPVARKLSKRNGVLEPLQTKDSINGQVEELKKVLEEYGSPPVVLIGWSWGAWLALIFAAKYPESVEKLILVSSGPFEEKYAELVMNTRLERLSVVEKEELYNLNNSLNDPRYKNKDQLFTRFGEISDKTDTFSALDDTLPEVSVNYNIYKKVWREAEELRQRGKLLQEAKLVRCPVLAIHGVYDPHPSDGVRLLSEYVRNFRIILLDKCGHAPWKERFAHGYFYEILKSELSD